ncbi:glycerol kinase GlpK [Candidatus Bathyarchaeota archaeon]|nr:glycerol kinase GlpK [Candidatus Bathyarchaeota archaeon]
MGLTEKYVLALDEGTTSARAIVFDEAAKIRGVGQSPFRQLYPAPGWVEQNPETIWEAQVKSVRAALKAAKLQPGDLSAVGVTNQRETTILWDRRTGKPIHNAIVWQCRRTADAVETLKRNYGSLFKERTGLIPDSYFSGPKVAWILENVQGAREQAERGDILFGTVDTYLIHRLTGGRVHATDCSNASRTLMFDIRSLRWDDELLEILGIPEHMLPEVKPSSCVIGYTDPGVFGASIPVAGVAGDQQAALFGHAAFAEGESKCTYGTGNFLLMNTGHKPVHSEKLLATVAWGLGGDTVYALEGSVFVTGAAVQWLRDELRVIDDADESEALAMSLEGNEGVYFVPALTGLGAPYWNQYARGLITGLTRGTGRAHIARAALEAVAYLTRDVVEAMERDSGLRIGELRVDGGATRNGFLMQFQADILGAKVLRPREIEATAKGAAFLAGLAADVWGSPEELRALHGEVDEFSPAMSGEARERLYRGWGVAVGKALSNQAGDIGVR